MKDLVFIRDQSVQAEPYTTSRVIAECAEVQHHTVTRLIQKYENDLNQFGLVGFDIDAVKMRRGVKHTKTYNLNEQQATLLITYLQNTEPVRAFKKELVRQFYLMREELTKRRVSRQLMKPTRRSMTDAIRDNTPPEKLNRFTYTNYTDMAYKAALGLSVKQIKQARAIPEGKALVDYMSATELEAVKRVEAVITALLDAGANSALTVPPACLTLMWALPTILTSSKTHCRGNYGYSKPRQGKETERQKADYLPDG